LFDSSDDEEEIQPEH